MLRHFIVSSVDSLGACSQKVVKKPESQQFDSKLLAVKDLQLAYLDCQTCNGDLN